MDSYNLFGDDGSGMLEGLTDLGGADSFAGSSTSGVTGDNKDSAENSYRQPYNPNSVGQEGTIQKLASFGGGGASGIPSSSQPVPNPGPGPPGPEYHDYGAYPPRPRLPQPPHAPLHPSHHVHPSHSYPSYHPGPEPMYTIPEQGIADMGVWSGAPGANRYSPITPGYRHSYEHQQKMHQYSPQQASGIGGLQAQNGAYIPRQPHFPQPTSQQIYGQQQNYPNYTQMHPPSATRISQHPTYHQQMDVNAHQYGLPHNQQSHGAIPQHQPHQNIPNHPGGIGPGIQSHPNSHLHHAGAAPLHHVPRQPQVPPSSVGPSHAVPSQMPYGSPHHSVPINYQPHQVQHPLDVNVTSQYNSVKPGGMDAGSPQYRPPFPQLSPQMSPRAQVSPRQQPQSQPQLSPRPVMSPVKGPSASPLSNRNVVQQSPGSGPPPVSASFSSQNTLQALEQMVLPASGEYSFQRNPASPVVGHNIVPSPTQWNPNKMSTPINTSATSTEPSSKPLETPPMQILKPEQNKMSSVSVPNNENKNLDKSQADNERTSEDNASLRFITNTQKEATSVSVNNSSISTSNQTTSLNVSVDKVEHKENSTHSQLSTEGIFEIGHSKEEKKSDVTINHENKSDVNLNENLNKPNNSDLLRNQGTNLPSGSMKIDTPADHSTSSASQQVNISIGHPLPANTTNKYDNAPSLNISRSQGYQNSSFPNIQNMLPQGVPNLGTSIPTNIQSNQNLNVPPTFQSGSTPATAAVPNIQSSIQSNHAIQHPNLTNTVSSSMPVHNQQGNLACLPPTVPSMMGNIQPTLHNSPSNVTNVQSPSSIPSIQVGMPLNPQNIHGNLGPNLSSNQPNVMSNIPHNMNPNMIVMGSNNLPHPSLYSASHHQERAALQQQIQEIYCLPPSNENQEKVRCLQERLSMLQQHETNDKCNGGPNCILQNPIYGSKMVESPQVTSTTGRGRGKGPAKPRKPRVKKDKLTAMSQSLDQLPVSEDCVTAGTGLQSNSEIDTEVTEDITNLDSSALSIDEMNIGKVKKPRAPRKNKERKPRVPKELKVNKDLGDKPVKERKKREPKDPNAPKRKRNVKKGISEMHADTTTYNESLDRDNIDNLNDEMLNKSLVVNEASKSNISITQELPSLDDTNVTDFDDIPVSKIAIKDLLEEAEAKKDLIDKEDELDSVNLKKKTSKKRTSGVSSCKKTLNKKTPSGKRKRRGGLIPDSDGEPDDLMSTPPPSPPPEGDDSLKRRSARNTQRKKYTDDVLLRLSDDEFTMATPKQERELIDDLSLDTKDLNRPELTPKPNYMYVNTTEEDSMIVQHVLASRMGKREIKNEISEKIVKQEKDENGPNLLQENPDTQSQKETDEMPKKEENIEIVKTDSIEEEIQSKEISKIEPEKESVEEILPKTIVVDVEEYFVKYRNFSYLHCEWKTEEELYKGDKRIFSKIKRFKQKQAQQMNIFELLDDEPFNPDYVEVERILDMSENQDPANNTVVKHYLVKWKSLQYEDSTWELEEDIDVDKIKQYKIFSEIPPKEKWKFKKRPSADQWAQLKESPLYKGGNTLRPYQLEGLNWLLFSWHNNRNCILADEMGLGKTIQSLTFVNSVWEYGIRGPFLIIAPLSTIPNWQREFEGWTEMNVIVYHGSQQSKSMLQEYEFYYKNEKGEPIKEITKFNVLITTFEIIVTDFQELKSFNWRLCVIDEAHRLKNRNCKLLEGLRQLHLEHRVLLSGTPLQNNVNELFSLLNFLEPSQFSSSDAFLTEFGQLRSESEVVKLQALLKPMMLRRLKEDVEKTLAPKEETIIEVELTNIQKKYYRAILERNFSFLQKGIAAAANIPNLMNTMMELRKCCIHPYLLNGAEDQIQFDYKQANGEDKEAYYKALIQSSGKMVLVDKLLPKLKAGGHRVLIFSQMVRCLDILEDYLLFRKYPFERIDGRIRGNLRQEAIDRFSKPDSDRFVFLLCTKAGGLGINLTAADTVIIYDSDWNPQNDLQAQARCHRIGQQKMVKIYRLICRNTYEREMFDKASLKLGLDKAILQSMNTSQGKETGLKQLSKKEIEDLLKKGAYGAVMDEDNAGDKFCEEDIEMILARRTQVIQMESEKGSTFSKASFAATDQRSDIDIRDPDFWNKWAKKAEIDTTEKKEDEDLIVTEPRKRTIIKRYGHDDGPMEMSDMEVTPDSDEDEEGISLRSKRKKEKLGRKGRRYASDDYVPRHEGVPIDEEVVYGSWTRSECFKIERGLLTFGSEERKVLGSVAGDEECTDDVSSGAGAASPASPRADDDLSLAATHLWPSMQDLNTRLRRLITAYQRNYKREELKLQQRAKMERRERMDQLARDEISQWRWTRADEEAFRRTVASYGVEFDPATKSLRWSRFRSLARLDSKSDDALTDYLKAFMAMCKRQCGLAVGEAELPTRADLKAEPIGEERAIATLERIDLLRVLREEVAPHPALEARLALCERSLDAPPWWQPARHDKLLVLGVCKHGLGDTYNKLFCDPKLPFADCARKWHAKYKSGTKSDTPKPTSDDEEKINTEATTEPRMSLRRSKRTSNVLERDTEDDTDALSELETLAKLGRIDETLTPEHWFSERALETRLHHIAHAVQNCEWPSAMSTTSSSKISDGNSTQVEVQDDRKQSQKRHIAIDVETERAKLHALLSSPQAAHSASRETHRLPTVLNQERDDASSDSGSRRSTPAPPPAHQRVAPSPAPSVPPSPASSAATVAPVDLSTPLDLSEAQDFSIGRRTPQAEASPASVAPARSRLDDTLTRLMKRKNVPAPEQIVSKEKKRKKLDEIVLGLSAAKGRSPSSLIGSCDPPRTKSSTVLPEVTVTPAAPPSTASTPPTQKPFSVTVTNVPSPHSSSKELSSYLQQSLEQSNKNQKSTTSTTPKPYSHEAKVNKWLAEQTNVDTRRRGFTPRLAPDEHVPVVHRVTGKRLIGHKAPQLKHLAQWIAENPMYDIDSKWTDGIKEHVKLPQDVRNPRHSPMQPTSSVPERKKGRPPTLDTASTNVLSSNTHLNQNISGLNPALLASLSSLSAFDPKTLAATLSNLTGFDPKLLSSLSSFDPKNNPLLNSFSGMPNLLGNISGGNIFANLAGLGLPGFPSLDMNSLTGSSGSTDTKNKSRKPSEASSASTSKSTNSQFPFVFPNPNMLYPQLGLSGLSPFGVHSGMSSYDALGLLSSNLATSSSATSLHNSSHSSRSTKTTAPRSSTVVTSSSTSRQQKVSDRTQSGHLPQILLPPDPYLLESLSKQTINYDTALKMDKRTRDTDTHETIATDLSKADKKKLPYDPLRSQMPPEFAAVQEKLLKGDKKDIDISKMLLEQMASGALSASLVSSAEAKKTKDIEKDSYEKLGKPPEYITRMPSEDNGSSVTIAHKRTIEEINNEPENLAIQSTPKKIKDNSLEVIKNVEKQSDTTNTGEMDLEDLIAPLTVIKTGMKASDFDMNRTTEPSGSLIVTNTEREEKVQQNTCREREVQNDNENVQKLDGSKIENDGKEDVSDDVNTGDASNDGVRRGNKKKGRKSSEDSSFGPRRELRSSSGRQSTESSSNH
ncbi:chromodomain-helicase-DNA-binding protein 7-like isoform X2 [Vanessa cardui]|uniref:chromodomain-helicase-DNA-binding protein 7-like isoform X2 n=1 Tax=Vanessa cardui TaxID=171605 RepID=UPI001F140591|nr:chromodomain-helicase-DNA-binding protein 7-like isoform X2 [Vanessa cardui]